MVCMMFIAHTISGYQQSFKVCWPDAYVSGALHRAWMDLKSALGGGDHAILAATESVEDHAISKYRKALAESLPADVRGIVESQFASVKQSHGKVRAFRDSLGK
jgi:uncharacterized protein (TIGR02284 family)